VGVFIIDNRFPNHPDKNNSSIKTTAHSACRWQSILRQGIGKFEYGANQKK